jgi:hypothetical protein
MKKFKKIILLAFFSVSSYALADVASVPGFVACKVDDKKPVANCDYGYSPTANIKDIGLKVGGTPFQIPKDGITSYPAPGQTSAILFLVDISDPLRQNTVEIKNRQHVAEMILQQKDYQKTGVAVFDSEISILSPVGSDEKDNIKAINQIKAKGQATEFYKNILAAIEILKKTDATRKGLVIMSDGKDEDRAYKYEDVIKAASEANVVIFGLGYTEKAGDTPYLQTIKRLAEATNGLFIDASSGRLPGDVKANPFDFLEKGGRVSFDSSSFYGDRAIVLTLGMLSGGSITLSTTLDFPDNRNFLEKLSGFIKNFWWVVLIAILGLGFLIFFIRWYLSKQALKNLPQQTYAFLDEFDGLSTRHPINKTTICIGRNKDNDICLVNDSISSHHAEIHRRRDGTFNIVDLGSTNGVLVNNIKITQLGIKDGDLIELGEVKLNFSLN